MTVDPQIEPFLARLLDIAGLAGSPVLSARYLQTGLIELRIPGDPDPILIPPDLYYDANQAGAPVSLVTETAHQVAAAVTTLTAYDDFSAIQGVGPRTNDALHAASIHTWNDLHALTALEILAITHCNRRMLRALQEGQPPT